MLDFNALEPPAKPTDAEPNAQRDAIRADLLARLDWALAQGVQA